MSKIATIIISKDKIYIYSIGQKKFVEVATWTTKTFLEQIKLLKEKENLSKVQVLLSDDIAFVLSFVMDSTKDTNERHEKIASKIAERIPEYFENIVWDYKIVDLGEKIIVQVAAIERTLITQVQNELLEAKLNVTLIEPLSCAIAKTVESTENSKIVVLTCPIETVFFLVYKSAVFIVDLVDTTSITEGLKRFVAYTSEKYHDYKPDYLILADDLKIIPADIESVLTESNIKLLVSKDIFTGLSGDVSVEQSHKNTERLDLIESEALAKPSMISRVKLMIANILTKYKLNKNSKMAKIVMIIFVVLLLAFSLITVFVYDNKKDSLKTTKESKMETDMNVGASEVETSSMNNESPISNEIATEEIVKEVSIDELKLKDFSGYKLEILNGSGVKGEADKLRALLGDLKFTEIAIGNADKTDYVDTLVSYKTMKLLNNTELLDTRMTTYKMEHTETLLKEDNPYDIVIIIGKARLDGKGNSVGDIKKTEISSTDSSGIAPLQ